MSEGGVTIDLTSLEKSADLEAQPKCDTNRTGQPQVSVASFATEKVTETVKALTEKKRQDPSYSVTPGPLQPDLCKHVEPCYPVSEHPHAGKKKQTPPNKPKKKGWSLFSCCCAADEA